DVVPAGAVAALPGLAEVHLGHHVHAVAVGAGVDRGGIAADVRPVVAAPVLVLGDVAVVVEHVGDALARLGHLDVAGEVGPAEALVVLIGDTGGGDDVHHGVSVVVDGLVAERGDARAEEGQAGVAAQVQVAAPVEYEAHRVDAGSAGRRHRLVVLVGDALHGVAVEENRLGVSQVADLAVLVGVIVPAAGGVGVGDSLGQLV